MNVDTPLYKLKKRENVIFNFNGYLQKYLCEHTTYLCQKKNNGTELCSTPRCTLWVGIGTSDYFKVGAFLCVFRQLFGVGSVITVAKQKGPKKTDVKRSPKSKSQLNKRAKF